MKAACEAIANWLLTWCGPAPSCEIPELLHQHLRRCRNYRESIEWQSALHQLWQHTFAVDETIDEQRCHKVAAQVKTMLRQLNPADRSVRSPLPIALHDQVHQVNPYPSRPVGDPPSAN